MFHYIHVSFDEVTEFVPRVPEIKASDEDGQVKRICVGTDLIPTLGAVPGWLYVLDHAFETMGHVVLHVYTLGSEKEAVSPGTNKVWDCELTGERWLLDTPATVTRTDILIRNAEIQLEDGTFRLVDLSFEELDDFRDNMDEIVRYIKTANPAFKEAEFRKRMDRRFRELMANWESGWTRLLAECHEAKGEQYETEEEIPPASVCGKCG